MVLPYSLSRSLDPSVEPVSLDELKSHLNVTHSDDDNELTNLIAFGRQAVERDTGRSLVTQTWQYRIAAWPSGAIELFRSPLQSVSSITYVDTAGDTQTWASGNYDVHTVSNPGLVTLGYSKTWPTVRGDVQGITITYVTGYGDAGSDVPYELRQAIMLRAQIEYDGYCKDVGAAYDRITRGASVGVYP